MQLSLNTNLSKLNKIRVLRKKYKTLEHTTFEQYNTRESANRTTLVINLAFPAGN